MVTDTLPEHGTPPSDVKRPVVDQGILAWLRKNLFRTPLDAVLTVIVLGIGLSLLGQFINWVINGAEWTVVTKNFRVLMQGLYPGEFIQREYGDQGWRLGLSVVLTTLLAGLSWGIWGKMFASTAVSFAVGVALFIFLPLAESATWSTTGLGGYLGNQIVPLLSALRNPMLILLASLAIGYGAGRAFKRANRKLAGRLALLGWGLLVPVIFFLVRGINGVDGLPVVSTGVWGGLVLTFMLAFVAIVCCFPLGVLLALGRTSGILARKPALKLSKRWYLNPANWLHVIVVWWRGLGNWPIFRLFCVSYIEFFRGVPLVTVFFIASVIVPLALRDNSVDGVVRAMIALTLFEAAYIAEIVRGGLQAIPPGQIEAARAIGLNPIYTALFITLPQAIRIAIPTLVGQFITMFKDTSLIAVVGLFDLLGIGQSILKQPEFMTRVREVYVFITVVYFVFSYGMSYAARQLERSGSGRASRAVK